MKFWPTRQKHTADLVADLDSLVSEPVSFRVHGKEHVIDPVSTEEFFKFTNAYARLFNLTDSKNLQVEGDKLIDAYFDLFSSVCKTITRDDITRMTQAQVGALFQLITETVTGKVHVDQKKTLQRIMLTAEQINQSSTV